VVERDDDLRLMRRLAEGEDQAMAALVERWQVPVLSFVCRFLGCSDDEARDVAQEAFLRVWRQRERWRPTAAFSTWLFTIVSNLCRNRARDLGRRPALLQLGVDEKGDPAVDLPAPLVDDPHARAEAAEAAARLRVAISRLPENQRVALLLRRFANLSYREIGDVLGVTPSAVDSLLVRARRALADALDDRAQDWPRSGVEHG